MVIGVENNVVSNNGLNVGVLTPPAQLAKPELYNERKADAQFKQLSHDIYEKEKSSTFENVKKTPLSALLVIGAAALTGGWLVFKNMMKY